MRSSQRLVWLERGVTYVEILREPPGPPAYRDFQHASQPVLDEGIHGMILGLAEGGFKEGATVSIQRFNAENDTPTENAIAREVAADDST